MKKLLSIVLIVSAWWITSRLINSEVILPPPHVVFGEAFSLLKDPVFWRAISSTLMKGVLSTVLVTFIGVPIGMVMGAWKAGWDLIRPLVLIVQAVPVISWLAVAIFAFGMGWKGPVLITVLSLLPVVSLNVAAGFKETDIRLVEMAKIFKISRAKIFRYIYLGSLVPFTLASLEITLGNVWKTTVVAEFLAGDSGIGVMIAWARNYVDTPRIYALTLFAVALAFTFEWISRKVLRRIEGRWRIW